ncbi:MAG: VOC family protein [Deinococcales bacterium]|nr:VOC family protein [Deinococcales bacterium]
MSIALRTAGVHHIALRVTDLERSKRFYVDTLGFPVVAEFPGLVLFSAGNAVVGIRGAGETTPTGDAFDPFRVGLDHIALVCEDEAELDRVAARLEDEGIWSTGAKTDEALGKRYVAFKDPDGIKWEYFMA